MVLIILIRFKDTNVGCFLVFNNSSSGILLLKNVFSVLFLYLIFLIVQSWITLSFERDILSLLIEDNLISLSLLKDNPNFLIL